MGLWNSRGPLHYLGCIRVITGGFSGVNGSADLKDDGRRTRSRDEARSCERVTKSGAGDDEAPCHGREHAASDGNISRGHRTEETPTREGHIFIVEAVEWLDQV